jgi:CRP/FNR family transcriptional activator FtrB
MLHTTDMQLLAGVPPLSALPPDALQPLLAACHLHTLPPGTALVAEGAVTRSAFLVLDGAVELTSSLGDDTTVLAIKRAPAAFLLSAMQAAPAAARIATCTASRVLFVPAGALRAALVHPPFVEGLLSLALAEHHDTLAALKSEKLRTGPERAAEWLLTQVSAERGTFRLPHDKRRIARLLGMAPEHLTRTFAALAAHGVRVQGERVTVSDPGKLRRLARLAPSDEP